jgi:hypothetical protein
MPQACLMRTWAKRLASFWMISPASGAAPVLNCLTNLRSYLAATGSLTSRTNKAGLDEKDVLMEIKMKLSMLFVGSLTWDHPQLVAFVLFDNLKHLFELELRHDDDFLIQNEWDGQDLHNASD